MVRNTHFYENIMFTDKVNQSIAWGGKGNYNITLMKWIINERV